MHSCFFLSISPYMSVPYVKYRRGETYWLPNSTAFSLFCIWVGLTVVEGRRSASFVSLCLTYELAKNVFDLDTRPPPFVYSFFDTSSQKYLPSHEDAVRTPKGLPCLDRCFCRGNVFTGFCRFLCIGRPSALKSILPQRLSLFL